MAHILDRPIWSALTTAHVSLAEGGPLAYRYPPSIAYFAAARDDSPESSAALAKLAAPGEQMRLIEANSIVVPAGCAMTSSAEIVQMVAERRIDAPHDERIERLSEADAQEMLDLALLTKPGPFTLRAQSLGRFWGIRENGRLIAMAGERLRQHGFSEVSGVCTHPDFRGRGIGRLMSLLVAEAIAKRGETPYLHAYATNQAAIGLYRSIGFAIRRTLTVAVIQAC